MIPHGIVAVGRRNHCSRVIDEYQTHKLFQINDKHSGKLLSKRNRRTFLASEKYDKQRTEKKMHWNDHTKSFQMISNVSTILPSLLCFLHTSVYQRTINHQAREKHKTYQTVGWSFLRKNVRAFHFDLFFFSLSETDQENFSTL